MKVLVTGGVKSGKSKFAELRCLELAAKEKAVYLATSEIIDPEMQQRIAVHQSRRKDRFVTIEEPLALFQTLQNCRTTVLVECLTMWINNMLFHKKSERSIFSEIEKGLQLPGSMVFVINEVGAGVIPDNLLARQFIDISGKVSQIVGKYADEVHLCVAGQSLRIK
ncbi:MAG: bifunctional adenosylcobinamide kinase/adenosylcobinamide-phosphate guanylyltransferase [SAR324 cluster bacterium]|nr:bifunctional adenosylcobinamide kinase/adenosylcobinamide-phosphate guanylyltransferase [SAR324 cluster bacterium]